MASISVQLRPFTVPNFVIPVSKPGQRQDGIKFAEGIPLKDLNWETLNSMCADFRVAVFAKAGVEERS